MAAIIGEPLPRRPVAWAWFGVSSLLLVFLVWKATIGSLSWIIPGFFSLVPLFVLIGPFVRPRERETVQVDEVGVRRVEGDVDEQVLWDQVEEVRIITTDQGPFVEDVFFALSGPNETGCLVPHDAAVRTRLLETLQARFKGVDNEQVIAAMGCTSNNNFLIWSKNGAHAT